MRGHVRKRGQKWAFVVDVGRDESGKRIQRWHSGFERRKEAEHALSDALAGLRAGTYVEPSKLTLAGFVRDEWLPQVQHKVRPSTYRSYQGLLGHLLPAIGHVELRNVTPPMLNKRYGELLAGDGERQPLAASTVRLVHTLARQALADAVKWGRLARNPADSADPPSASAAKSKEMATWDRDQLRSFLEFVRQDRLYAAWRMASTTGARRGELLGLRWRDLDLDAARASIVQTLVEGEGEPRISEPKTASGRRSIALDAETVAALRVHRKAQAAEKLALGPAYDDHGLVFCREDGVPLWPRTFSRTFERHVEGAGLPQIRLHDLRHSYATLALQAGIHPKVVSERLGHASVGITLDTYSHAIPAMQEDAASKVAALLD
jgi:integrase